MSALSFSYPLLRTSFQNQVEKRFVYNGKQTSINELAHLMIEITGVDINPVHVTARQGEIRHSQADISRAVRFLGYEPKIGLEEGLKRTMFAGYRSIL